MEPITVILAVVAAVLVFVIAAVTIGREARRLDAVAPRAVYEITEAVDYVADMLPAQTQARLTMAELDTLLRAHMQWLHAKGLQPRDVIDHRQDIFEPLVISEDSLSAYLLGEADRIGVELLDDVDVIRVVEAHLAYFDAIGAVGPSATDPDLHT
jgi:hypothetical protein